MKDAGNSTGASPLRDDFVSIHGARQHYLRAGTGPPLLLLHGLVGSCFNWRMSLGPLAQVAAVYALDQMNMGRSQRVVPLDAGLEATADRLAATMDALGLDTADVGGHSHGGAVAMMFAARHPDRIRRLILAAPANPFSHPGDRLVRFCNTLVGRRVARCVPHLPRRVQLVGLARMCGNRARVPEGSLQAYMEGLSVPGTMPHILDIVRAWFADMAKLNAALPLIAEVPSLLLWGDRDRAVDPASAAKLHGSLHRSELHMLPGAGHILFEEFPGESNRIILHWLRRTAASSSLATFNRQISAG